MPVQILADLPGPDRVTRLVTEDSRAISFTANDLAEGLPADDQQTDDASGLPEGSTVVVDRGMSSDENIAEIKARKLHYLVASRQPERTRWLAEFEDPEGFTEVRRQPSPRNPGQKKTHIEVKTQCAGEVTYVLCRSEQRTDKDRAIRTKQEGRLLADLDRLSRRVSAGRLKRPGKIAEAIGRLKERYPRVARYYELAVDPETAQFSATLKEDERAKAAQLDGCYLIKTDRHDLSADDCWRIYALLTRAEDTFRDIKTPLAERPIYHQKERRVDTHIFLCVLATKAIDTPFYAD
ncbi:MAG: transposase [Alphaproteobacteria bacterium]|nr:transposase [Alphaproteobacteria bacterium]